MDAAPGMSDPVSVRLLAVPESTPTALYGFLEVFAAVGVEWAALTGEVRPTRRIDARIVARDGEPFRSALGPTIEPATSLDRAPSADVAIVTDLALKPHIPPHGRWQAEAAWLRGLAQGGAAICSVCTGSVLLAEAGLLDGVEATTHWSAASYLAEHYPQVRLRPERILCPAGPEHRIITSGGPASWEDLALHLIGRFCGRDEAVRIAKIFVFGDRSQGQQVFAAMGRPRRHADSIVADCQIWLADHYTERHPVAQMVRRSGLSERTFLRRFSAATGHTPVDYVQALRIEEAKQLLEASADAVDDIASEVGYDDPASFRRLFKRRTGVTPAQYRRRFSVAAARPETA